MKKVDRLAVCSLMSHESLFDLDYSNSYCLRAPQEFFQVYSELESSTAPVISTPEFHFFHKSCDEVLLLLIFTNDGQLRASDKISVIQFGSRFIKLCKDFMGKLTVENVLANVTLLAEIVDCVLIGGFLHLTDTAKVKSFLSHAYTSPNNVHRSAISSSHISSTTKLLDNLSGRGYKPELKDRVVSASQASPSAAKEDLYIDMVETLDCKVSQSGETTCTVRGVINSNNVTNGLKEMDMQLNKSYSRVIGQHCFASCVDSSQFNTQGLLKVNVPVGQTQLLTYQLTSIDPPFTLEGISGASDGELIATLHCALPAAVMCLNVTVSLKLTEKSRGILKFSNMAKHSLELEDDKLTLNWNIPEIAGQTYTTAQLKVLTDGQIQHRLPSRLDVSFKFEISNYLHSKCRIASIKLLHSKKITKWIRHLTVAGDFKSHLFIS